MLSIFAVFLIGLATGAIVNYLSDVLPIKRQLVAPICLHCEARQSVVNYFFWPRRCKVCGRQRKFRAYVVELVLAISALWLWLYPPENIGFVTGILLLMYFGLVTVIDIEHRLILNPVSLVGAAMSLIIGTWLHGLKTTLVGGIIGFLAMLFLYFFGGVLMNWLARRRGKVLDEDALGFGDVNLSGILGLLLGWPGVMIGLILTILLAGVFSLLYLLGALLTRSYRMNMSIPYGPFLISSAFILLFFREYVLQYLGW